MCYAELQILAAVTQNASNTDVARTTNGFVYVGSFNDPTQLDWLNQGRYNGSSDGFIVEYLDTGSKAWGTTFGGDGAEYANAVALDGNSPIVVGSSTSARLYWNNPTNYADRVGPQNADADFFVVKFSPVGSFIWGYYNGSNSTDNALGVAVGDGTVFVCGTFSANWGVNTVHQNNGSADMILIKLNSTNGQALSSIAFGGSQDDTFFSVTWDSSGFVYVVGEFYSNNVVINGNSVPSHQQGYNAPLLVKLDQDLVYQWHQSPACSLGGSLFSVTTDYEGNVLLAGHCNDAIDVNGTAIIPFQSSNTAYMSMFAKLDSDGSYYWVKLLGCGANSKAFDIAASSDNSVYVIGAHLCATMMLDSTATPLLNPNAEAAMYIGKYEKDGNYVWSSGFVNKQDPNWASKIAVRSPILGVSSQFSGSVDFGITLTTDTTVRAGCYLIYNDTSVSPSPTPSASPDAASTGSSEKSNTIIIAVVVPVGVTVVGGVGIAIAIFLRKGKKRSDPDTEQSVALKSSPDRWEINYNDLTMDKELGRGAFGIVYHATWRSTDCVVKKLENSSSSESFMKEAKNVKHLRPHPNICQILGVCTDPEFPMCIVMEFVPYGSLWDMLVKKKITMTSEMLLDFAGDVAKGMNHLHSENIIHCDLACRNLLVAPKDGNKFLLKITDFGLSRVTEQDIYNADVNALFPVRWTAPEAIRARIVSKPMDVWSYGIVLWEMSESKQPYPDKSNTQVIEDVCDHNYRLSKPHMVSDTLYSLMIQCWETEPKDRPSFASICEMLNVMTEGSKSSKLKEKLDQETPIQTMNQAEYHSVAVYGNNVSEPQQTTNIAAYGNAT